MACLFSSCKSFLFGVFIIVASFIPNSDARYCQTSQFGTNCKYHCHCINNEQCNAATGECDSGCDFDWVGPACQHKNIAYGKLSRHIDNQYHTKFSDRANDNDTSTCSYTDTSEPIEARDAAPWWTLWFPTYQTIRKLSFVTHENYRSYFPNFKLKVQNDSLDNFRRKVYKDDGMLCYQHDASIPPGTRTEVTCTGAPVGNLLRLQLANTSTQLVLCDFRVYGDCMYGDGCRHKCNINCNESGKFICDPTHGTCLHGCKSGWTGQQCKIVCGTRKWGPNCAGNCGNCAARTCDRITGNCGSGCAAGYKNTSKCVDECDDGTYGNHCAQTCGMNCINFCNKTTGTCSKCNAGWTGEYCKDACVTGKWGSECANSCGNCRNGTCDHETGKCATGCAAGYQHTDKCVKVCEDGTYGLNCTNICTNCLEGCDKVTGICSTCNPGWEGDHCTAECESGKWDSNCLKKCGNCSSTPCNRINGHCLNGCKAGIKPTVHCNTECEHGTYGATCMNKCSQHCLGDCDKDNGYCTSCEPGWTGNRCDKECYEKTSTLYSGTRNATVKGIACQRWTDYSPHHHISSGYSFPERSITEAANYCRDPVHDGSPWCYTLDPNIRWQYCGIDICQSDCSTGTFGEYCLQSCNHNCKNGVCSKVDGRCLEGCEPGYTKQFCNKTCKNGTYGQSCIKTCSEYCKNNLCKNTDGFCVDGCKAGYHGDTCKYTCDDWKYGKNCVHDCSSFCKNNSTCRKTDGICEQGCSPGYIGYKCDKATEKATDSSIRISPETAAGFVVAVFILIAISIFVTFLLTRKRMERSSRHNAPESETVTYSNVLAADTKIKDGANDYEPLDRKEGSEHIYG